MDISKILFRFMNFYCITKLIFLMKIDVIKILIYFYDNIPLITFLIITSLLILKSVIELINIKIDIPHTNNEVIERFFIMVLIDIVVKYYNSNG